MMEIMMTMMMMMTVKVYVMMLLTTDAQSSLVSAYKHNDLTTVIHTTIS